MHTIRTTVNIRIDLRNKIIAAAVSSGISVNDMILRVLTCVRKSADIPVIMFARVRYQARSEENEWTAQHVTWRVDDYERFQDLRRLWKMAVSFILAYGIENYLNECSKKKCGPDSYLDPDNNPASYFFISKFDHNNEYFVVFWKYPTGKIKKAFQSSLPFR